MGWPDAYLHGSLRARVSDQSRASPQVSPPPARPKVLRSRHSRLRLQGLRKAPQATRPFLDTDTGAVSVIFREASSEKWRSLGLTQRLQMCGLEEFLSQPTLAVFLYRHPVERPRIRFVKRAPRFAESRARPLAGIHPHLSGGTVHCSRRVRHPAFAAAKYFGSTPRSADFLQVDQLLVESGFLRLVIHGSLPCLRTARFSCIRVGCHVRNSECPANHRGRMTAKSLPKLLGITNRSVA